MDSGGRSTYSRKWGVSKTVFRGACAGGARQGGAADRVGGKQVRGELPWKGGCMRQRETKQSKFTG